MIIHLRRCSEPHHWHRTHSAFWPTSRRSAKENSRPSNATESDLLAQCRQSNHILVSWTVSPTALLRAILPLSGHAATHRSGSCSNYYGRRLTSPPVRVQCWWDWPEVFHGSVWASSMYGCDRCSVPPVVFSVCLCWPKIARTPGQGWYRRDTADLSLKVFPLPSFATLIHFLQGLKSPVMLHPCPCFGKHLWYHPYHSICALPRCPAWTVGQIQGRGSSMRPGFGWPDLLL